MIDNSLAYATALALHKQGYVKIIVSVGHPGVDVPRSLADGRDLLSVELGHNHGQVSVDADALRVTLTIHGHMHDCVFPWDACLGVLNADGAGVMRPVVHLPWSVAMNSAQALALHGGSPPTDNLTPEQRRKKFHTIKGGKA